MKNRLLIIVLLALFYSCNTNDEIVISDEKHEQIAIDQSYKTSEEEAKETLYKYLAGLSTDSQLKSTASEIRIVKCKKKNTADYGTVNSTGRLKTEAENSEPIPIYEFITSSENDKYGFALVVGDSRFDEVIAYAPEGSLADTIYNEGLALFISAIPNAVHDAIKKEESLLKNTKADYYQPDGGYVSEPATWTCIAKVYNWDEFVSIYSKLGNGSLNDKNVGEWDEFVTPCRFVPTQWDQGAPYNDKVDVLCQGVRAKAGCGAVALTQIMAYHKKPTSYNWNLMTSSQKIMPTAANYANGTCSEVSRLMIDAIKNANIINYCKEGTISAGVMNLHEIVPALNKFGYSANYAINAGGIKSDSIYQNLIENKPILLGAGITYLNGNDLKVGHIWIVDGLSRKWRNVYTYSSTYGSGIEQQYWEIFKYRERCTHIHCNWGWGGSSDGWYYIMQPINEGYSFSQFHMWTQIKYNGK